MLWPVFSAGRAERSQRDWTEAGIPPAEARQPHSEAEKQQRGGICSPSGAGVPSAPSLGVRVPGSRVLCIGALVRILTFIPPDPGAAGCPEGPSPPFSFPSPPPAERAQMNVVKGNQLTAIWRRCSGRSAGGGKANVHPRPPRSPGAGPGGGGAAPWVQGGEWSMGREKLAGRPRRTF